ncbi:MAG: lipase/acyltransferase domain-containing protein [Acidobacteriota bacterium]
MPTHPVLFIPGYPASELLLSGDGTRIFPPSLGDLADPERRDRLIRWLTGSETPPSPIVAGEPIRDIAGIFKEAQSLYDLLRDYGYSVSAANDFFQPLGWDWRSAVDATAVQDAGEQAIATLAAQGPVVVIVHSTGGLVLRALLEQRPALAAKIAHVLAFGVPWAGSLKAVRYLARGEKIGFPALGLGLTAAQVRTVMRAAQAAYDLFPPGPPATDMTDADGDPMNLTVAVGGGNARRQIALLAERDWIPAGATGDAMRGHADSALVRLGARTPAIALPGGAVMPPVTCVAGWGVATDVCSVLGSDGAIDFDNSWNPGPEGDGTVPLASASWLRGDGVRTFHLPIGVYPVDAIPHPHDGLWSSPPVLEILDQVLLDKPPEPFVCAAADGDQAVDPESVLTIRFSAADAHGEPLADAQVVLPDFSPETISFAGRTRLEVIVPRTNLHPNAGSDLHRLVAAVEWTGGRRELPVVFRV